jgi:cobalamin biosynthesis protein CobW
MSHAKIPATIITGFLGAGKTTLLRNLLSQAKGRRIALIINEFGDVGVDGEILKGCGDEVCREEDVIELANGCICCTVADDFIPVMEKLLARDVSPDNIIIETSGLALPQPLVRAFNWPGIASRVTVDAVVTVADANALAEGRYADDEVAIQTMRRADPNLEHENPIEELFEDQLNCADIVILSKIDLLSKAEADDVYATVSAKTRKATPVIATQHGNIAIDALLGKSANAERDIGNRLSHHEMEGEEQHDHDDFVTFHVDMGELKSKDDVISRVERVIASGAILRLKGFAAVRGADARYLVQAVGPRSAGYFDRPWLNEELRVTRLVVIGVKGIDQAAIAAQLAA